MRKIFFLMLLILINPACAHDTSSTAVTQSISSDQIVGYDQYPPTVQNLITQALDLANQNLTYLYGSADPKKGGMDCSGTIDYLLRTVKVKGVPRQANEMYVWVWKNGKFYAVNSPNISSFEFSKLKPGDLLFWSGTYAVDRDPPITHVMLYLGKNQKGEDLMFGASEGRSYQGQPMRGVSVFDFQMPRPPSTGRFVGYSCIPSLTC